MLLWTREDCRRQLAGSIPLAAGLWIRARCSQAPSIGSEGIA